MNEPTRRLVALDLIEQKTDGGETRVSQVRAVFAGRLSAAAVTVDARNGRVVAVERFDPLRVPFDEVDLQTATSLALAHPQVRAFLGRNADRFRAQLLPEQRSQPFVVQMLPVRGILPTDPCTRSRCVDLVFRGQRGYLTGRRVTVNLSDERVEVSEGGRRDHD